MRAPSRAASCASADAQRAGEHGIRRLLVPSFDRGGVVLAEPLEGGRPRVALVRDELVQHGERHRIRAVRLVGDGAGEPGRPGKRRLAREEVSELELGARARLRVGGRSSG